MATLAYSQALTSLLQEADFSKCSATVVGYGNMGREFVKALQSLGIKRIWVCRRSKEFPPELKSCGQITVVTGGYQQLKRRPGPGELAIIATPVADLIPAAYQLRELGYRKVLIEKPISLRAKELRAFASEFGDGQITVRCGYNRAAYPALLELKHRAGEEGGITSCTYTFTEFTNRIDPKAYPDEESRRWGIANSLHVMSMAHALIGMPKHWNAHRGGRAVAWHPAGSVFVGSGISEQGIPFAYHADWGSTGRWSVEAHTKAASYRLCPLEQLLVRRSFKEDWQEVTISAFAAEVKVGFVEQVASMLKEEIASKIPLLTLEQACRLTEFGEEVFGYENEP